jgi:hypothetical protein
MMTAIRPIARVGTRNIYLGPDGRTGMHYREAKAAHTRAAELRTELDAEVAYSKATGFGDHAKIARLDAAIAKAGAQ